MDNLITKEAASAVATAGGNRLKDIFVAWKDDRLKSVKSWAQFSDKTKFGPPKPTEIHLRIKSNITYFLANYIILFFILAIYCVITNPFFLFSIAISVLLYFYMFKWRQEPIVIAGYTATERVKMGIVAAVSLFLFWYASVGNTIFWLIGATGVIVFIHALLYTPVEESDFDFSSTSFQGLGVTGSVNV
eukprot:TRINITY_DN232_c0_g1_i2.p1 TRINITY_DN232_c0_g1~~TRINITY_DN232_c0_g1_i2.p1  ORF type:complete len:189 (-),score=54.38 TRINITY_DN232_c0_g1_i2:420-986(-)